MTKRRSKRKSTVTQSQGLKLRKSARKRARREADSKIYGHDYGILPSDWSVVKASAIPGRYVSTCFPSVSLMGAYALDYIYIPRATRIRGGRLRTKELLTPMMGLGLSNLICFLLKFMIDLIWLFLFDLIWFAIIMYTKGYPWVLCVAILWRVESCMVGRCLPGRRHPTRCRVGQFRLWMNDGGKTFCNAPEGSRLDFRYVRRSMHRFVFIS